MKHLQNLEIYPPLEGATTSDGDILVNVEMLWDLCKGDEELFARLFAGIIGHEYLHTVIRTILPDKHNQYCYGEELIIRDILGQSFSKKERRFYRDKRKATGFEVRRHKPSHK